MRTKKILAILSAIAMMGCLASCGGNSSTADSSSTAETTTAAAETTEATTTAATTTTAEPIPAADAKAITFDTDSLYTAEAVMDNGAAPVELSIEEVNGNKKLKVHVLKAEGKEDADYEVPKIKFDLPALLGAENVGKIGHISADFYCNALETWKNDDGSESLVVGNFLGAFGGNIASDKAYDKAGNLIQNNWANHYESSHATTGRTRPMSGESRPISRLCSRQTAMLLSTASIMTRTATHSTQQRSARVRTSLS